MFLTIFYQSLNASITKLTELELQELKQIYTSLETEESTFYEKKVCCLFSKNRTESRSLL